MNEISLLLIFAIEMALSKELKEKKSSIMNKIMFIVDLIIIIYLWSYPIYPGRFIFSHSLWKYALLLIIIFVGIHCFTERSKSLYEPISK